MNIALGFDANLISQAETLIKSICCHNKHVKIYVFNEDLPQEWFDGIKKWLSKIDCELINVVINSDSLKYCLSNIPRISQAAYNRFYISDVIQDKALYLDADIVVNGSLKELFEIDLGDNLAGGVLDLFLKLITWEHPFDLHLSPYFNSGVLLINCDQWRKEGIRDKLFDFANKHSKDVPYGDQCTLNYVLKDRWINLPYIYNYQARCDTFLKENKLEYLFDNSLEKNVIYHFCADRKPWKKGAIEHRELYWHYYHLEWNDVIKQNLKL